MQIKVDDTVMCIECDHFRLKDAGQMANHGFGLCDKFPRKSTFMSSLYPRRCGKWRMAGEKILVARRAWVNKQNREDA